ncbi:MAG TPA: hypothetical protein VE913_10625 [Longimicrobium sp.]|nr:hypothetical protein [Longimicrobium sp.]
MLDNYDPADATEFAAKSPRTLAWLGGATAADSMGRRMSLLASVRAGLPPVLIIHGDADPVVPFAAALRNCFGSFIHGPAPPSEASTAVARKPTTSLVLAVGPLSHAVHGRGTRGTSGVRAPSRLA